MFYRCAAPLQGSCVCRRVQLLLCRVRGECGLSACLCRSDAVGAGLAGSGLPCVEDASRQVQVWCSWSSSAHFSMHASRRLREPASCVAFTGAGLSVEPVEGVPAVLAASLLLGDELSLLPVGLSVLQSAWALSVKVWCAWLCIWLLRWPACLVSHFQVSWLR
ncbi:hypothetical protein Taro_019259 [Colocasia esculenta]|uniref:Uncharacterized protein n=1 Tax=Colocasia esculenta TaxID=4460 RepID=A0A843UYP0_COLES|nr:hypothetical protein [Colocasia esculenta]